MNEDQRKRLHAINLQLESLAAQVAVLLDEPATQTGPPDPRPCGHPDRQVLNTMGGGPLREMCKTCGVQLRDGAIASDSTQGPPSNGGSG